MTWKFFFCRKNPLGHATDSCVAAKTVSVRDARCTVSVSVVSYAWNTLVGGGSGRTFVQAQLSQARQTSVPAERLASFSSDAANLGEHSMYEQGVGLGSCG
jgi:hypothetical protein